MQAVQLRAGIDAIAAADIQVSAALAQAGYPEPRLAEPGFASLVRILVGQQLSIKAAASIHGRFVETLGGQVDPDRLLSAPADDLRSCGLSHAKIRYAKAAAQAVTDGDLDFTEIAGMAEEEAEAVLTQVKGVGPWTAQIYLLFCEGRPDVWPAGDLALQEALRRLKSMEERPKAPETFELVEPWRPWRGAMAVFLWHYYAASGAPV